MRLFFVRSLSSPDRDKNVFQQKLETHNPIGRIFDTTMQLLHTLPRRSFRYPLVALSIYQHLSSSCAPSLSIMNPRELVDHIRSGPAELVLDEPLRFRRRTRSNPCDFNEFLQALQSSETIRIVRCRSQLNLGITEDEWVLLVKTLGSIKDIQNLVFYCAPCSRDFHPFQAVAEAVHRAHSLHVLAISLPVGVESFPRDSSGLTALANALRGHTALQAFVWLDCGSQREAAPPDFSLDLLLRALPACPHLRTVSITTNCASAGAIKTLLHMPKDTTYLDLSVETEHWLAVADGIRQGRCNIKHLNLAMYPSSSSSTTEAVKAIASAIQVDRNLESLDLQMENGFTDEAGVALAEALTVNKTLRKITLSDEHVPGVQVQDEDALSAPAYEAFCTMLRVNTSLVLELPPFKTTGADERLVDSRNRMRIEQGLNHVGRGRLLASRQTTRKEWMDALNELNSSNVDESPEFNVSCLYSLLRLNPETCMS
jgi:hypothetical protein